MGLWRLRPQPLPHLHLLLTPTSTCNNTNDPSFSPSTSKFTTSYRNHASRAGRGGYSSAPLDKGKRVVEVVSDDEDSAEGQVFKRQRTQHAPQMVASATSSSHGAESLREDPSSATSPPQSVHQERGFENEPVGVLPPAPELPLPMQESLRGFLSMRSPGSQTEKAKRESMYYYMGLFMSCAYTWHKPKPPKLLPSKLWRRKLLL